MAILASVDVSAAAATSVLRVVGGTTARRLILCNDSAAAITVDIWFVGFDETRGDQHLVGSALAIRARQTVLFPSEEVKLEDREEIFVNPSAGTLSVTVMS